MLRRKEEGKLKAFEKYFVDEKKNTFLDALWSETLSLAFIGVYFHCWRRSGHCFWNFLGFIEPCTVKVSSPPVGSLILLSFDYGTFQRHFKFVRVSLGYHHREPYSSLSLYWFLLLSLSFLDHGNIF